MQDYQERSAYPHPEEFEVMRPEYSEAEDGYHQATITIAPFTVRGRSVTKAGARRAAVRIYGRGVTDWPEGGCDELGGFARGRVG